ncbi:MAG TPA: APC family permease [Gammaproteobacteria bacterium]|nr:APC family permease [Gammaproteobacteria bacterium]
MSVLLTKLRTLLLGKSLNPTKPEARRSMLLVAFLAWVGLGADGLSSACYGPEIAFLALGQHTHLALYLAMAIALTVFIIALSYNQVIELFPSGGGGYKVATQLIGPYAGLTSGVALIVDYVLTICVSIASCVDALFSLFPLDAHPHKLITAIALLVLLGFLNLRGMKESIKILIPIFLTFFITHALLILYGILKHSERLTHLIPNTYHETINLSHETGWIFILALFLRAYSLGGGTYTGIEAISNNVNRLSPPRVTTGKWAMGYMAFSLSFIAGGIILLYLLWDVVPTAGLTLNAVTFKTIMSNWVWHDIDIGAFLFLLFMASEAGLLFVAANTGYIGGPTVLSNMAADSWCPAQFRHLSSRLVTQNGIVLIGIAALLILLWTRGHLQLLIVMYSINVFLTFSLSLFGLSLHWFKAKKTEKNKLFKLSLSLFGLIVTASILVITIFEKFEEGGWVTLLVTGLFIFVCLFIKRQYTRFKTAMEKIDAQFKQTDIQKITPLPLDPHEPTAIFFVGEHIGIGMYTLKKVLSLFPNQYKNFIFLSVGEFNGQTYDPEANQQDPEADIKAMRSNVIRRLSYFVNYCRIRSLPAIDYQTSDVDVIEGLSRLAKQKSRLYPNCVFFAGTLIFQHEHWINHWLHNHTAKLVQERLQSEGLYMMLLPIRINELTQRTETS